MDWATKREYLFKLDPKRAHDYLLKYLSLKPRGKQPWWAKNNNRLGLAAGFDVNAKALWAWESLGFGFVEVGTVTLNSQEGATGASIKRILEADALLSRLGFPNEGIHKVVKRISAAKKRKLKIPVYLNVAKGYFTSVEDAPKEFEKLAEIASGKVDAFVINLQNNFASLHEILPRVIHADPEMPIFLKVGLSMNVDELKPIIRCATQYDVKGIIVGNALPVKGGMLSGKPLREYATSKVAMIKSMCGKHYAPTIIASGGVDDAESAREKIEAGADFIEVYTGLVYNGFDIVKEIVEAINE